MRPECIEAVSKAIGRQITRQDAVDIDNRINHAMSTRARLDPQAWHRMSRAERLQAGADDAARGLMDDFAKMKQRAALAIIAADKTQNRYNSLLAEGKRPFKAVARILDDAYRYTKGVANEYFSGLVDVLDAIHPKFLGMVENAEQAVAVVREIFGEHTGNEAAKKAAKAWLETAEAMRQRFNAAGGDVGKLGYGYIPQPHDPLRILKAGQEQWVKDTLPLLDRRRYMDVNGDLFDDVKLTEVLNMAWDTLITGGVNKMEPGSFTRAGFRADHNSQHRELHFKDADSYLTYAAKYNKGGVLSAMQEHVMRMAKDIALVEEFGPNPNAQFRFLHDVADKARDRDVRWGSTQARWNVLNGNTGVPGDVRLAEFAQGVRNIEVVGKLGSALLASVTDIPTYFISLAFNRLGIGDGLINMIRAFDSDTHEFANRAGLIAESLISDMNRWAVGNIGKGWTGKLANATMKLSLLNAWTDGLRRGFGITMMGAYGKLSRLEWGALEEADRALLIKHGITETDFKVWNLAKPEEWRGSQMLTKDSIRAITATDLQANGLTLQAQHRAVTKLLGLITDEAEYASVAQDLRTRAITSGGLQKGTVESEAWRSIMLFKGFPIAMITRHLGRMAELWRDDAKGSAVAYGATLMVGTTIFGALALQLKDMVNGKDPRDMSTGKFWGAAWAQGGGLGVFGDLLYTGIGGNSRAGTPNWMNLLGPVLGDAVDLGTMTLGNLGKASEDKKTTFSSEALRFTRGHLPFVNLWYAKTAIDHAVLHDLQEYLSPGYLMRMQERARKDYGQGYWWRPGEGMPSRAPNLSAAA
jgi:hypothetical protein